MSIEDRLACSTLESFFHGLDYLDCQQAQGFDSDKLSDPVDLVVSGMSA